MEILTTMDHIKISHDTVTKNAEQAIEETVILPDYCPEIEKVISVKCETQIITENIEGNDLAVSGNNLIILLYADPAGNTYSFKYSSQFAKKIDLPVIKADISVTVTATTSYLNCKLNSPRKAEVKGAVNLNVEINGSIQKEFIKDIADATTQTMKQCKSLTSYYGSKEQNLTFDDEISIPSSAATFRSLIKSVKICHIDSCKIINNKSIIKGNISYKLIYCDINNKIQSVTGEIPFNQIVDVDGADDNSICIVKGKVSAFEVDPKTDQDGETRSLSASGIVQLFIDSYKKQNISYISDLYSTEVEIKPCIEKLKIKDFTGDTTEKYVCTANINNYDGDLTIGECWAEIIHAATKYEDGLIKTEGNVLVSVLTEADSEKRIIERSLPFSFEQKADESDIECEYSASAEVIAVRADASGDDIKVDFEIEMTYSRFEICELNILTAAECDTEKLQKIDADIGAVLYFAKNGETIWSIAKKYRSTVELIKEYNEISDEMLTSDKVMLIPIN